MSNETEEVQKIDKKVEEFQKIDEVAKDISMAEDEEKESYKREKLSQSSLSDDNDACTSKENKKDKKSEEVGKDTSNPASVLLNAVTLMSLWRSQACFLIIERSVAFLNVLKKRPKMKKTGRERLIGSLRTLNA